ncbi:hypothetical protein HanXRQr2_Chr15g0690751 [Helianthus annuus]|uniref:Uncharacterized protein n=1 Tax=Helianthus annuus TaxID=4232 RepID=A0A9K3DZF8_HELAN|nr:hypothetical protein HanXRQr2_Chr15g0690751 [Helianthus annuus]KAJ0451013.1 hypothetical protein HanHA300_Chr15g0562791 [Helianthus annuus]KAJ0472874.1 hypothetical protein HanHA89_Chr15g0612011 [Helianthus annuus]KAJ0648477.1 hypothetical protein HanLR1_Chr15g0573391 [Helianthus annuus]KAJ0831052.1 hypothetical protein HanPSC8_Chr15g0662571 [Helianthus annuus]
MYLTKEKVQEACTIYWGDLFLHSPIKSSAGKQSIPVIISLNEQLNERLIDRVRMADKKKIKSEASSSTSTIENVKSESVVVDVGRRRSSCG